MSACLTEVSNLTRFTQYDLNYLRSKASSMKNSIRTPIAVRVLIVAAVVLGSLLISRRSFAGNVPVVMNYQGQLVNAFGTNLPDGNYTLTFRIYDNPSGGNKLWGDYTAASVPFVGGRFNVALSADNLSRSLPTVLSGQAAAFLEIQVGSNNPITPRQQLLSTPYALYSGNADTLGGLAWNALIASASITGNQVQAGTITAAQIANGTITSAQIAPEANIMGTQIQAGTITAAQVANGTITSAQIAPAANITGTQIANETITSNQIATGTITAAQLAAATITAANLSAQLIMNAIIPPGTIVAFGGPTNNIPQGWLLCNGAVLTNVVYSNLYAAIGTSWGYANQDGGNLGATFCLPDTRGYFLRGVTGNAANDPDAGSRTSANSGGNTGDSVGSIQGSEFALHSHQNSTFASANHQHWLPVGSANGGFWFQQNYFGTDTSFVTAAGENYGGASYKPAGDNGATVQSQSGGPSATASVTPEGGNETRPLNVYVNYIIKY
jgi:microcystin-dependent protein